MLFVIDSHPHTCSIISGWPCVKSSRFWNSVREYELIGLNHGSDLSGHELDGKTDFYLGAVVTPAAGSKTARKQSDQLGNEFPLNESAHERRMA